MWLKHEPAACLALSLTIQAWQLQVCHLVVQLGELDHHLTEALL